MEKVQINHSAYVKHVRELSDDHLRYIIKDARAALEAMPDGVKSSYYADEIDYCVNELSRRQRATQKEYLRIRHYLSK